MALFAEELSSIKISRRSSGVVGHAHKEDDSVNDSQVLADGEHEEDADGSN